MKEQLKNNNDCTFPFDRKALEQTRTTLINDKKNSDYMICIQQDSISYIIYGLTEIN